MHIVFVVGQGMSLVLRHADLIVDVDKIRIVQIGDFRADFRRVVFGGEHFPRGFEFFPGEREDVARL